MRSNAGMANRMGTSTCAMRKSAPPVRILAWLDFSASCGPTVFGSQTRGWISAQFTNSVDHTDHILDLVLLGSARYKPVLNPG